MPRPLDRDEDDDDTFDLEDERPLVRSRRRLPWLRMMLFSGLCIAALAFLAQQERPATSPAADSPRPVPVTVLSAPPATWTPLATATPLYALDRTPSPVAIEARRHVSGGREDTMVIGAPSETRYGRISVSAGIPPMTRSFYVDVVRRAAEAGLSVERNAQTGLLTTKFGPVEVAAVTLAGPAELGCQAFRFRDDDAAFGFQGWLCGSDAQVADSRQLACFIDSLMLVGAADPALKTLFGRSEKIRAEACPPPARTASAGVKGPSRP
ncbi:hypothetical protein [Microvirga antarctica]|uniref:hypothetical protein n=1 Tax=Microvirga antarctica TaxID=2819233 RepID=UPI001B313B76|nr:hypothetical protein [Microvirga antarctica]